MEYKNKLLENLSLPANIMNHSEIDETALSEMMSDPRYLRQSSSLINDALQKGFDVLQLADGDIVMTGVKTVVYQYKWDVDKGKLVRTKASAAKKPRGKAAASPKIDLDELEEEDV